MSTSRAGRGRLAQVIASRGGLAPPEAPFVIEHREAFAIDPVRPVLFATVRSGERGEVIPLIGDEMTAGCTDLFKVVPGVGGRWGQEVRSVRNPHPYSDSGTSRRMVTRGAGRDLRARSDWVRQPPGQVLHLVQHRASAFRHRLSHAGERALGLAAGIREQRAAVLQAANAAHLERFIRAKPQPPALPTAVWINAPRKEVTQVQ